MLQSAETIPAPTVAPERIFKVGAPIPRKNFFVVPLHFLALKAKWFWWALSWWSVQFGRGGSRGVSRVSGHLPFCAGCPFLKIINFQNVYFPLRIASEVIVFDWKVRPIYVQFRDFFISENGRRNLETMTYIQVSRARPLGPAWLRRFKQKFRLACLVGTTATAHWTQVNRLVDNWRRQRDALLPANKTSAKRALLEQPWCRSCDIGKGQMELWSASAKDF